MDVKSHINNEGLVTFLLNLNTTPIRLPCSTLNNNVMCKRKKVSHMLSGTRNKCNPNFNKDNFAMKCLQIVLMEIDK